MSSPTSPPALRQPTSEDFVRMHGSEEFHELRSTFRAFTIPVAAVSFIWFLVFLAAATYFPRTMGTPFAGLNIGMWLGIAQFVTAFLVTWVYVRFATTRLEPRQQAIREKMEN